MYSIGITETLNMFCDQLCIQSCFLDTPPPIFTFLTAMCMCLPVLNCFTLTEITTEMDVFTLLNHFLNPY